MTPREKARLYHDLGQLLRSGVAFPNAVEKLSRHTRGAAQAVLRALRESLGRGLPLSEAFAELHPRVDSLELGIFTACERAGRLEHGLAHAAEYYEAIAAARSRMWSKSLYPLFVLHFALAVFSLTGALGSGAGFEGILPEFLKSLGLLWLVIGGGWLLTGATLRAASANSGLDRLLRTLPMFGKLRRAFSMGRFCTAYDMQLDAGINVFTCLEAASRASGSAVLASAGARVLADVRAGGSVGEAMAKTGEFPEPVVRAFVIGEESGSLEQELKKVAREYQQMAMQRLEAITDWLPRLLYLAVLLLVAWQIIGFYLGYFRSLSELMK